MRPSIVSFLVFYLSGIALAISASGNRLLVVLDETSDKDKYSKFWADLTARGFEISYKTPKSDTALFTYGARAYDHLLLLPSRLKALGPALTGNIILDFLKADGNILLALSSSSPTPTSIVSLLLELDVHLPTDRSSLVVDHFNYDSVSAGDQHDVLLVPHPAQLRADVKNFFAGDGLIAVPRAVGQSLGAQSPLLAPILKAPRTAYSYSPKEDGDGSDDDFASGTQLSLVSALQARNSARFTVLGSSELLEDIWFDANVKEVGSKKQIRTANREFASQIAGWTFKETGVLKVGRLEHWLDESSNYVKGNGTSDVMERQEINPAGYRIKNHVRFSIEVSEHTTSNGYAPFDPPAADELQLEFTMLSPYHRLTLQPTSRTANSTVFTTKFKLPDQHGIFSFRINYKRPFLTVIDEKHHATVRHFAHDEWPRSWEITGAWVWIAGIWATVAAWIAFIAVWLYCEPTDKKRVEKKVQ